MKKLCVIMVAVIIAVTAIWGLIALGNTIFHKSDVPTKEMISEAESTARSLIASWESDVQIYRDSKDTDPDKAEDARMSANLTAEKYNEFMLVNSYLWGETLPSGIYAVLEPIE